MAVAAAAARLIRMGTITAVLVGGLAVAAPTPATAGIAAPAAPWIVARVASQPSSFIQTPNAARGNGFALTGHIGELQQTTAHGRVGLDFTGKVLGSYVVANSGIAQDDSWNLEPVESVRGGRFLWAQEAAGVDLDGDGASTHTGYFWVSGDGPATFVRDGKPVNGTWASFGDGAGIVVLENEAERNLDLDGSGAIEPGRYDAVVLRSGGTAEITHVQELGLSTGLERNVDGSVGGGIYVSPSGAVRAIGPSVRILGHLGDTLYFVPISYMLAEGPLMIDLPGVGQMPVPVTFVRQDNDAVWVAMTEIDVSADTNGDGNIDTSTVTCRFDLGGTRVCVPMQITGRGYSTGDGRMVVPGRSTVPSDTQDRVFLLGSAGVVASHVGQMLHSFGAGTVGFVEILPPVGGDQWPGAAVRIVRDGMVESAHWSRRNVARTPNIVPLGDGRAFVWIHEGTAAAGALADPFATDLNDNGRLGDTVTFMFADGALRNLGVFVQSGVWLNDPAYRLLEVGGPLVVTVSEQSAGVDLNGDADLTDGVAHVLSGSTFTNLGLAVRNDSSGGPGFTIAGPDEAYVRVWELDQGVDFNGDGAVSLTADGYADFRISRNPQAPPIPPVPPVPPVPPAANGVVSPSRLLDTRGGGSLGYVGPKPTAGHTIELQVAGRGGVPSTGVRAVALNVTITGATAAGFVTVWGDGTRPNTSNLNVEAGQTVPNMVLTPVGADGKVRIYTDGGGDLLADVAAWWGADYGLQPLSPERLLDTRGGAKPAAGSVTDLQIAGRGGAPASGPMVAVLNVTMTEAINAGFLTVFGDGGRPETSNMNAAAAGHTVANLVIVPVGADGKVHLFNDPGSHLIADIMGVFTAGVSIGSANRVLDSRNLAKPSPGNTLVVPTGLPAGSSVALNVTATQATSPGFVTVWPGGERVNVSNLNLNYIGQTVANLAILPVGHDGSVRVFTDGGTHVIVDILARFTL